MIFILEPVEQAKAAIGKRVTVVDYPNGRLSIRHKGVELAYRTFDKLGHVPEGAIIENKRLGAALAFIREQQIERAEVRSGEGAAPPRSARRTPVQSRLSGLGGRREPTAGRNSVPRLSHNSDVSHNRRAEQAGPTLYKLVT